MRAELSIPPIHKYYVTTNKNKTRGDKKCPKHRQFQGQNRENKFPAPTPKNKARKWNPIPIILDEIRLECRSSMFQIRGTPFVLHALYD